jgi:hypothetical protein
MMGILTWVFDHVGVSGLMAIGALIWVALVSTSRWVKKESRLSRNLRMPVYLVADKIEDWGEVPDKVTATGGLLRASQVKVLASSDLHQIPDTSHALVVVFYIKPPSGEQNDLLASVVQRKPKLPFLVYSPDNSAVTTEDRKLIAEKYSAVSNFPLRLFSDIWAVMCTRPASRPKK